MTNAVKLDGISFIFIPRQTAVKEVNLIYHVVQLST